MEPENDGLQLRNLLFQKSSSSFHISFQGCMYFQKILHQFVFPHFFATLCVFQDGWQTESIWKFDTSPDEIWPRHMTRSRFTSWLWPRWKVPFRRWLWLFHFSVEKNMLRLEHHFTKDSGWIKTEPPRFKGWNWWFRLVVKKIKPYYTTNQSEPSPQTNHQSGFEVAFSKRHLSSTKPSTKKMKLHKHTLFSFKDLPFGCRCHKLSQLDLPSCPQFTHQVAIFIDFSEADLSCFAENWASHEPRTWWFVWGKTEFCRVWYDLTHSLQSSSNTHSMKPDQTYTFDVGSFNIPFGLWRRNPRKMTQWQTIWFPNCDLGTGIHSLPSSCTKSLPSKRFFWVTVLPRDVSVIWTELFHTETMIQMG